MSTPFTWMLDTNTVSQLIRQPGGSVAQRLALLAPHSVCLSVVVACEMRFGARKKGSAVLQARVDALLAHIPVLPLDVQADAHYADIRHTLACAGTPIGNNDLFIAAHARALGLVLVTDNLREFQRVPGLVVENWLGAG
jgi:tRNA(fMet)-specific endonuclease VapC